MSYKKYPKTSIKTVDVLAAKGASPVGCFVSDGKLVPAINSVISVNRLAKTVYGAWYSSVAKMHVVLTVNGIYYAQGAFDSPSRSSFTAKNASMVEMRGESGHTSCLIGNTLCYHFDTRNYIKSFKGGANSCVLKNGRIFGIDNDDPYKIKWSGEGGVSDWKEGISGAGWTTVQYDHGPIINLIVYKDKIVAVRENGLAFLTAYGNPENFKLSYLERKLPQIYKNTVAVVDARLIFCTEDGLYFYDGNSVEKCTFELADDIENPTQASCSVATYYLCGTSKRLGGEAVLVFNAIADAAYLIDAQVKAVSVGENIIGYSDTYVYELSEGGSYTFTSGELDFSSKGLKTLKEINLKGGGEAEITVSNGVISRIVGGVCGKYRPNMRGKSFKITVCGTEKLEGVSAVAEVADGV